MKINKKCIILAFFVLASIQGNAQKLMNTIDDVNKIKANEIMFIGHPLKKLLSEIKPEIKMVSANPSEDNSIRLGYLIFRFVDITTYDSLRSKGKYPVQFTVMVKEPFIWDMEKRSKKTAFSLSKEDCKRLANLTVLAIRIFGQ